ncbi:MAG: hypothetical protein CMA32_02295 [Euryarchaeota archaeon]|uniref:Uncharacterized protein n=1 Tax=Marine Group III euryarchaeote CG-Epi2 TaxID=1888996 RepID=A0A1J5UE32_9ARCH|nr:hypothetical protein [Euryarchaeota archaeon]OIR22566.1 MAG: hypothetical protein BET99_00860 [Marine Group III euryarchaeote CG-Epi2]|tara:strand:- start:76 stop:1110 length:1035 start_codon:yes stop_codon:yes gene_type:complete
MRQVSAFIAIAFAAIFLLSFNVAAEEPEYENPDLQLKFNFKGEGDMISPQTKLPGEVETTKTVTAQSENWVVIESGRETVVVGTWTSEAVGFDLSVAINSFDIWWESMESDSNDDCIWTIEIQQNDQQLTEVESDCTHGGGEVAKGEHSLSTNIDLVAGDTFGIKLSLTSWEDVKIYYDNVTYDTGLNVVGGHVLFFGGAWVGSEVNVEFAEAWPVNWDTNLDGGFVMVMGADGYMADNSKAEVSEGSEYTITLPNGSADITSTIITWTEVTGVGIKLMMDYTTFDHMAGNSSANGTAKPALVTLTLEKAVGILGDDGGLLGLPGFEIAIAIPAIAFVARKFRN